MLKKVTHFVRRAALVYPVILAPLGCSGPPRTATAPAPRSTCAIVATGATAPDSIWIAATSPVDASGVPIPENAAERFTFAQLYETLVNVDCEGRAYPGLAKSWTMDASRTRATLVIRDGARFWNGKPVVAADVVTAWRATGGRSTDASRLARRMAEATTIVDDHTLTVSLPDTAWRLLADPALAIYQPQSGAAWAEGTTEYRVAGAAAGLQQPRLVLASVDRSAGPSLVIQPTRTNDARDAIDRGADVVVTNDPLALAYAQSRPMLASVPLPWSRSYALLMPSFEPGDSGLLRQALGDSAAEFRGSLARDAVRVEARAAEPPYWWSDIQGCESLGPLVASQPPTAQRARRIAYDLRDRVARRLAERLVALGSRAVAVPLAPDAFARAVHDGSESGYVIALPRGSLDFCENVAQLVASAPWIIPAATDSQSPAPPKIVPLVETRDRAIVNRDRVSATIDWDGTLRFGGGSRPQ